MISPRRRSIYLIKVWVEVGWWLLGVKRFFLVVLVAEREREGGGCDGTSSVKVKFRGSSFLFWLYLEEI